MDISFRTLAAVDYDALWTLWNSTEQTRRALNPVDDSRAGFGRYVRRNPETCFAALTDGRMVGAVLGGHDGRRGIIHHLCVHPEFRRRGIAAALVRRAENALHAQEIAKILCLVFRDNDGANAFWEQQGYSVRTNLNYRNKSLDSAVPTGE